MLAFAIMMRRESFPIANIYVPIARRATLNPKTVDDLAENILQNGQKDPILVRRDGERFVLIEGLHRLELAGSWARRPSGAFWCRHGDTS